MLAVDELKSTCNKMQQTQLNCIKLKAFELLTRPPRSISTCLIVLELLVAGTQEKSSSNRVKEKDGLPALAKAFDFL